MLELVGGDTSLPKGNFSDKSIRDKSLGLDFANLLQEAQFEQESAQTEHRSSRSYGSAEQGSERAETSEEDSSLLDKGEEVLEKKKVSEEENAGTPYGVTRADRPSEEQQESEGEDDMKAIEVAAEDASWLDGETGNNQENVEALAMDTADFEAVEAEIEAPLVQNNGVVANHNPLELLNASEIMDPDLSIHKGVEQIATRITQAANGQAAVMEEMAETVLPQVIRSVASIVRAGGAEMRLQLQPADLGEIELRVRTAEAAVRGELVVSNPEVKQLLEQNLGRLRDALAQQGLDLEGFSVDVGGQYAFNESREEFGHQTSSDARAQRNEVAQVVPASSAVRMPDSGDVDFTA